MVQFDELKFISPTVLQVNASIIDLPYYENEYIDSIIIDTDDTYCESGPSSNPVLEYQVGAGSKEVRLAFDMSSALCYGPKMFFVWVTVTGFPTPDTPCRLGKRYTLKAVVSLDTVYNEAMKALACATNGCACGGARCTVDADVANFSLQFFRMQLALEAGDYGAAYDAFCFLIRKRPSKKMTANFTKKPCGCNG